MAFVLSILTWVVVKLQMHWRTVLIGVGVVFFLATIILAFKSCGRKPVKVDSEAIERLRQADEQQQRAIVEQVVSDNAEAIIAVDERTEIAANNVEARNEVLAEKIAEVNVKVAEAKRSGKDISAADLECLLIGDCK